jgi:hypothetical protein
MPEDFKKYPASKQRNLSDLIEFVKTRTGSVTNYTLLLGAGASVTSGISSATTLIDQWRKELYERLCTSPTNPYSPETARQWLAQQHPEWYSAQREYASLFERKFDLPRQRRMFVEQQVSDRMPGVGYAYLIRLVNAKFFNTIFTTNFDDLLNESFHQFSDVRPLVCAHDSSISSITVTSTRPKIIKLHGDYLFDDIKSTLRETESLEDNTKKKFIEFAKDHGLIVVGYAGHDRSVMDVLQYLLKQDEYFKHGVYWCVRAGDVCSDELAKLLWKERAYWVEIPGFDEFMAILHRECIGMELPIDTTVVSDKPRAIITRFCTNQYLIESTCNPIRQDLAKFKLELDREALVDSLRAIAQVDGEDERKPGGLRDADLIKILAINQLIEMRDYSKALEKINEELAQNPNQDFKESLLQRRLDMEEGRADRSAALRTCDALMTLDPNNASFLLLRARNEHTAEARISCLDQALNIDPYYPTAFRLRASYRREQLSNDPNCNPQSICEQIVADYEMSIKLNPGITNPAWGSYAYYLLNNRLPTQESRQRVEDLLLHLKSLDPYSAVYLSILKDYVSKYGDDKAKTDVVIQIRHSIANQPRAQQRDLKLLLLRSMKKFQRTTELITELSSYDTDHRWQQEADFIELRADIYAEMEGKPFEAIRRIESYKQYPKNDELLASMLRLLILVKRNADARKLFDEHSVRLSPDIRDSIERDLFESAGNYDGALAIVRRQSERARFPAKFVLYETHNLLKLARWSEAEAVARRVLNPAHFSNEFDALIINLEISVQRQGRKVDKNRLSRLVEDSGTDPMVQACAEFLIDDKQSAVQNLTKAVEKDRTLAYTIQDWALFDPPANRAWLTEALEKVGLSAGIRSSETKSLGLANYA